VREELNFGGGGLGLGVGIEGIDETENPTDKITRLEEADT
jgi:hypothetical protein